MDVVLNLGGLDIHELLSTYRTTKEVEHSRTVVTLDGAEYSTGFYRTSLAFSLLPLTEEQAEAIFEKLSRFEASVEFTNQWSGRTDTRIMRIMSGLDSSFALRSVNGKRYYKGGEIQLRAKYADSQ